MVPPTQKAIVVTGNGIVLRDAAVPKPGPDDILVKVAAAAQNPTDCERSFSFDLSMTPSHHS